MRDPRPQSLPAAIRSAAAPLAAFAVALAIVAGSAQPSSAAFDSPSLKCRAAVAKSAGKFAKTALKSIARCYKARDLDGTGADCTLLAVADPAGRLQGAAAKFASSVQARCGGSVPADLMYGRCPSPCAGAVPVVADFADVVDCQVCLARTALQDFSAEVSGLPHSPLADPAEATCHLAITKASNKFFVAAMKVVTSCQSAAEKAGADTTTDCADTDYAMLTSDAYMKAFQGIGSACETVDLPSSTLDACGDALTVFDLAACAADVTAQSAQDLVSTVLATDDGSVTTTTTTTTTTTLGGGGGDPQCPDLGELVLYSRNSNIACTTNADCGAPRTCDTVLGTCSTTATLDSGWTGQSHGADINDGVRTRARLVCPGPAPTCGECNVVGVDPAPGNCRCSNDTRTVCDQPFASDADDCGGATCDCYFGSPFPLASGGTPACVVNRFSEDISGTADVDLGAGEITARLRTRVYLGIAVADPCPVCGGRCSNDANVLCNRDQECAGGTCQLDAVAEDGVRGGVCIEGDHAGLSCDVSGRNTSMPAYPDGPGGAGYSLDCMPSNGANISGSGLIINLTQTTGTSQLASNVSCGGQAPGLSCPCLQCSGDTTVPCNTDAECSAQAGSCSLAPALSCAANTDCATADVGPCRLISNQLKCDKIRTKTCTSNADCQNQSAGTCKPSTCSSDAKAGFPLPNDCDQGLCADLGGGKGECSVGPDDTFCDGVVKADGGGIYACAVNVDCAPSSIGIDAGACALQVRRSCFLDPIVATGDPDPDFPVAVSTLCIPPTSNSAINTVAGLPGPGRVISQGAATTFCAGDHGVTYQPGVGGCP